jgi:A/G-specific adenine glycosylase
MAVNKLKELQFTQNLIRWHESHNRPLPWKGEKNPYLVWLSEIILQQTRVEQGLPYFEKFRQRFPDVHSLAAATEDEVLKLWEGLGYYSRARNLHQTARFVSQQLAGRFPESFADLRLLKGIGDYTAAAIASFAFGLPHAVVDGNVFRVLARVFGIFQATDSAASKKKFRELAEKLLDKEQPARYNQAIMDFGASQCTPANPACSVCPMNTFCSAHQHHLVNELPVKSKKITRSTRYFNYLVINHNDGYYIRKRTENDIWKNLYEFPMIETTVPYGEYQSLGTELEKRGLRLWPDYAPPVLISTVRQVLTHQVIEAKFWNFPALQNPVRYNDWELCDISNLKMRAFPLIVSKFIKQNSLPLKLS